MVWGREDTDLLERALDIAGRNGWLRTCALGDIRCRDSRISSGARLLITHDSGIMHLAATAGTKVLAIFGPTSYRLCGPYGAGSVVVNREVECSPCYPQPKFFSCPHDRKCLNLIPAELVAEIAEKLLDEVPFVGREEIEDKILVTPSPCL